MTTICAQPKNKNPAETWPHKGSHDLNDAGMVELTNINQQLQQRVLEYEQKENEKTQLLHELGKRNKELRCLFGLSRIIEQDRVSIDELCRGVVDLILPAWQYPEITCARLILEDREFRSDNFKVTWWRQSADLRLLGKKIGEIEVYYLEEKPEIDEGPFLQEERNLIEAIAERLGRVIERMSALQEIETLARFPGENANPVLRIAEEGTVLYGNAASLPVLKSWGCGAGQPIPGNWQRLIRRALSCGQVEQVEMEYCDRTYSLTLAPVVEADYVNVYGMDITQRKQAENEIKLANQFYLSVMNGMMSGVWVTDKNDIIEYANKSEERITGIVAEKMIGSQVFQVFPERITDNFTAAYQKVKKELKPFYYEEVFAFVSSGRKSYQSGWLIPRIVNGEYDGLICTVEDVTEHKLAEEALKESEHKLLHAQKMEAVGRLAGGIAHDFNNLLTAMIGYCDLTLLESDLREPVKANISEIRSAAERAASLTQQLLAFSRRQVLEPRIINLNSLITNLENMLRRLIGEDVLLTTNLSHDEVIISADPGQIEQVIMNLVVNARDAMPDIGKLVIETRVVALDENYCSKHPDIHPGSYVLLTVSDTGHGMSEETQKRNFELLITDVIMPNMNGRVLAENIKNRIPEMKVLYVSGYTDEIIAPHGVLDSGVSFLHKPFTSKSLAQKIREVLNGGD